MVYLKNIKTNYKVCKNCRKNKNIGEFPITKINGEKNLDALCKICNRVKAKKFRKTYIKSKSYKKLLNFGYYGWTDKVINPLAGSTYGHFIRRDENIWEKKIGNFNNRPFKFKFNKHNLNKKADYNQRLNNIMRDVKKLYIRRKNVKESNMTRMYLINEARYHHIVRNYHKYLKVLKFNIWENKMVQIGKTAKGSFELRVKNNEI